MARAIITAPVARDLASEYHLAYKIPGATNGVLQAWDTNNREFFAALSVDERADLTAYTRRVDVPAALRPYLIAVLRSDSRTQSINSRYIQLASAQSAAYQRPTASGLVNVPGDFFRVRSSVGVVSVKLRNEMVAGDKPVDWFTIHDWLGIVDDLGETD